MKSANRLVFALANAPRDWGAMATLTFRERVMDARPALRRFQRALVAQGMGCVHYSWVREYQGRGAVHLHWLWEKEALQAKGYLLEQHLQPIVRQGKQRKLIRGPLETLVVAAWSAAVGDQSPEFQAFQWGGIVEALEDGASAARYFGSYLAKADQKTLPEDAEKGGRWWFVCPEARPVPIGRGWLKEYPFERIYGTVFDKLKISIERETPTPRAPLPKRPKKR